jgi:tetratricopeptide (TPR) repeat protein
MRYIALLLFFILALHSSDISFKAKKVKSKTTVYTVQLFSAKGIDTAKKMLSKVPASLQDDANLYKVGNYIAGRYSQDKSYDKIKEILPKLRDSGFTDAYVLKTTLTHMREEIISKNPPQKQKKKRVIREKVTKEKISKYSKVDIIQKATLAYKKGNESEAMIYYEMLIASGYKTKKIINNLCYLYGKRGAWFQAKRIIDEESFRAKYLYAYAYGAVQTNQNNFYENLSPYIMLDKSGRLMLLSGYYFEKNGDGEKANSFYKMAYEQNPSDVYGIFSYARSEDMQNKKTKAKLLYKQILEKISTSHPLYKSVSKRVSQI